MERERAYGWEARFIVERIGSVNLVDLDAMCRRQGLDGLPFPFFINDTFSDLGTDAAFDEPRFDSDATQGIWQWVQGYSGADIWVESRIHRAVAGRADTRVLAYRTGDDGFLAAQRADEAVIDVYLLPAAKLGTAVAEALPLSGPGSVPRIAVPGYANYFPAAAANGVDDDDEEFVVSTRDVGHRSTDPQVTTMAEEKVMELGAVQARCRPAREWGIDWDGNVVAWLQIQDDGDYLHGSELGYATPMSRQDLIRRIDLLVGEAVRELRELRGMW